MRRFIILAALAMAPASAVSADPPHRDRADDPHHRPDRYPYEREGDRYNDGYSDGYYDRDGRIRDYWSARRRWTPIAEENAASNERQLINVWQRGVYRRLLVEGVRGAPVIHRVAIEFGNRQTQVWNLHRRLPRGADQVIDLGGRKTIRRIIVYTEPSYRGAYSIYGA